jgi:hypothetical protein
MQQRVLIGSVILACFVAATTAYAQVPPRQPHTYFREHTEFKENEIRDIESGKVIVKDVDTGEKPEVVLLGAVYIRAPIESFAAWFQDPNRFAGMDSYIAYGKFSDPPQLSDVADGALAEEDFKALPKCKPGDCDLQLPTANMEAFQENVDWSSPDAHEQVNVMLREAAVELVNNYRRDGNAALGVYQDKDYDLAVDETFATIVNRLGGLAAYLPELRHYLVEYPNATLANIEESFHWEHIKFGLRPTLRVTHVVVYRPESNAGYVIVDKQLYASHYFQVAVDLWFCVKDTANPDAGFYLITAKGSRQHGLTGFKGRIVRGPLVRRARGSLEKALATIQQSLEAKAK